MTFQRTSEQGSDGAKGLKMGKIGKGALAILMVSSFGVIHLNYGLQRDFLVSITRSDAQLFAPTASNSTSQQTKQDPKGINLAPDAGPRMSPAVQNALDARLICIERIRKRQLETLSPFFAGVKGVDGVSEKNPLLMIDPAYHNNFGDVLLTYGEYAFLQRLWNNLEGSQNSNQLVFQECNYDQARLEHIIHCGKYFSELSTSSVKRFGVWQAGGNWGDLYGQIHRRRVWSFNPVLKRNYSVLGMPQSLAYKNRTVEMEQTESIKRNLFDGLKATFDRMGYNYTDPADNVGNGEIPGHNASRTTLHPLDTPEGRAVSRSRVVFTWREEGSYKKALEIYPFATNLLVPDIAFQTGPFWNDAFYDPQFEKNTVDVLFLLRHDLESRFKGLIYNEHRDIKVGRLLNGHNGDTNLTHRIVDWNSRPGLFGKEDKFNTTTSVQLLKLGRVLICDRLHASILAYLSGVPFVYLDQMTNKVSNVLDVAFAPYETGSDADGHDCMDGQMHMWAKATSIEEAVAKAREMLNEYNL